MKCEICDRSIVMIESNPARQARVSIAYVGKVHRSCFEKDKERCYQMSLNAPQREEREVYCEDTTEWMYHGHGEEVVSHQLLFGSSSRLRPE